MASIIFKLVVQLIICLKLSLLVGGVSMCEHAKKCFLSYSSWSDVIRFSLLHLR